MNRIAVLSKNIARSSSSQFTYLYESNRSLQAWVSRFTRVYESNQCKHPLVVSQFAHVYKSNRCLRRELKGEHSQFTHVYKLNQKRFNYMAFTALSIHTCV